MSFANFPVRPEWDKKVLHTREEKKWNTQADQLETKFRHFISWSQLVPNLFKVICMYGKHHLLHKQIDYNQQTRVINVKEVVTKKTPKLNSNALGICAIH